MAEPQGEKMRFADLQLSGCAGCEVSLLNARDWFERYKLVYMPLVTSETHLPRVEVLLVTGGIRTEEDAYRLRRAAPRADRVVAVGTCAISGGVPSLGNRDDVRALFLDKPNRRDVPRLLPKCAPIDSAVNVDLYLPGCPPMPQLFMAALEEDPFTYERSKIVCQECGRKKRPDMKPDHLVGFRQGREDPDICLVNQGFLCVGTSVRGGCRAPCPRAGHPCVGCRGPSDALIGQRSSAWFAMIQRVFRGMTNIPEEELDLALRSPHLSLFLFQFPDYTGEGRGPREKEKVL